MPRSPSDAAFPLGAAPHAIEAVLPDGWTRTRVSYVCAHARAAAPAGHLEEHHPNSGTTAIVCRDDVTSDPERAFLESTPQGIRHRPWDSGATEAPAGSLVCLLDADGRVAACKILSCDMLAAAPVVVLTPAATMDSRYLRWALLELGECQDPAPQGRTGLDAFLHRSVVVPPLRDQLAAAAHLETATERIDALTEHMNRAIALLKGQRADVVRAIVTGRWDTAGVAVPPPTETPTPGASVGDSSDSLPTTSPPSPAVAPVVLRERASASETPDGTGTRASAPSPRP